MKIKSLVGFSILRVLIASILLTIIYGIVNNVSLNMAPFLFLITLIFCGTQIFIIDISLIVDYRNNPQKTYKLLKLDNKNLLVINLIIFLFWISINFIILNWLGTALKLG